MTKKEIEKKKPSAKNFLEIYDDKLPNLLSNNMRLQAKALEVIEEKIDQASAAQAATIYGILHDKVQSVVGNHGNENNTVNMYIGDSSMSAQDMTDLLGKVMNRMSKPSVVEAEFEVVNKDL